MTIQDIIALSGLGFSILAVVFAAGIKYRQMVELMRQSRKQRDDIEDLRNVLEKSVNRKIPSRHREHIEYVGRGDHKDLTNGY